MKCPPHAQFVGSYPNNIFKNRTKENKELAIVEIKNKNWYEKLLYVIKKIFKN